MWTCPLLPDSLIEPNTIEAYLQTHYQVHAEAPFILRVGQRSVPLIAAQQHHRADCSAFISACNPYSQVLDDAANYARNQALASELNQRGLAYLEGAGIHPSNQWPAEASFLVFGLSLDSARALAIEFEQNALLWSAADGVPQLILLR